MATDTAPTVETTIALPAALLHEAETVADDMQLTLSELTQQALTAFIVRHPVSEQNAEDVAVRQQRQARDRALRAQLNAAYPHGLDAEEQVVVDGMWELQREVVLGDGTL